jgi:outer membrane immunogenic protein
MTERGGLFGAQAGYLWELSNFYVMGVEADADWSGITGSVNTDTPLPVFGGNFTSSQQLDVRWTSSLRARLGVTPMPGLLLYATGGVALAGLRYNSQFNDRFNEYEAVSFSAAKPGWAAGAGVEYKFASAWSARLEYMHSQYNALSGQGSVGLTDGTTAYVAHSSGVAKVDSVRLAINYFLGN